MQSKAAQALSPWLVSLSRILGQADSLVWRRLSGIGCMSPQRRVCSPPSASRTRRIGFLIGPGVRFPAYFGIRCGGWSSKCGGWDSNPSYLLRLAPRTQDDCYRTSFPHRPQSTSHAQTVMLRLLKIRMILLVGKGVVEFWKNSCYWSIQEGEKREGENLLRQYLRPQV